MFLIGETLYYIMKGGATGKKWHEFGRRELSLFCVCGDVRSPTVATSIFPTTRVKSDVVFLQRLM